MPSAVVIDSTPSAGLSVISVTPVSVKSLPSVFCRQLAGVSELLDRLDSHRGHQQRVLLRGGADHAVDDVLHAGQPPSIETISTSPSRPTDFSAS